MHTQTIQIQREFFCCWQRQEKIEKDKSEWKKIRYEETVKRCGTGNHDGKKFSACRYGFFV